MTAKPQLGFWPICNLFDKPYAGYENGDARQVTRYNLFGRHVLHGCNYKF
ncbi:MAG: hypothetical protein ACREPT_07590 [Rudaea sp.]